VPLETVPQWVVDLWWRHPNWRVNICPCMLTEPRQLQHPSCAREGGPPLFVQLERLKSGQVTFRVKGRDGDAVQAAFKELFVETQRQSR
jgi:hypothetical protein